jgi:hypothetical protein
MWEFLDDDEGFLYLQSRYIMLDTPNQKEDDQLSHITYVPQALKAQLTNTKNHSKSIGQVGIVCVSA